MGVSRYSASLRNLRSLLLVRCIFIAAQAGLLWYIGREGADSSARTAMAVVLAGLAAITAASFARLQGPWPVTDAEFFSQLALDTFSLTLLLYLSGGGNNPFVTYYLIPVIIAAALLPRRYTWALAIASLLAYGALLFKHVPLPLFAAMTHEAMSHGGMRGDSSPITVHIAGMWINFLVSVGLITWFVAGMAAVLREQQAASAASREDTLRNEQLLAAASLAAGTAHELGTPLATISLLVEALEDSELNSSQREDLDRLNAQLQRCRSILEKLSRRAQLTDLEQRYRTSLLTYLESTLAQWQVSRPDATARIVKAGSGPVPELEVEPTLDQAIENLLNNAANACPDNMLITVDWSDTALRVAIDDNGPGVPLDIMNSLGTPVVRAGQRGLGLGLMISHATINRYGGNIELSNRADGGARALLTLPRILP